MGRCARLNRLTKDLGMDSSIALYSLVSCGFFYGWSMVPWTAIFLFLRIFGIHYYVLREKETCVILQKKIQNRSSVIMDSGKASGYSFGYWYCLHLSISSNGYMGENCAHLIATRASFDTLMKDEEEPFPLTECEDTNTEDVTLIERFGTLSNLYYRKRKIVFDKVMYPYQESLVEKVEDLFMKKPYISILLHGKPGSGKSILGLFLAKRLNGMYCDTMNPFGPGDTLHNIYSEADVDKKHPLIIVLDEIDIHLEALHKGIPSHKNLDTLVKDKTGWNRMLDAIQKGMFKHLILLCTTNKTPEYIHSIDPSYIREGRMDAIYHLEAPEKK